MELPSWKRNLTRQFAEVEALKSIYGGEGEFQFDDGAEEAFKNLQNQNEYHLESKHEISFTVHFHGIRLGGTHVSVRLCMLCGYPEEEPLGFIIRCGNVARAYYEMVGSGVREEAHRLIGEESGFQVLQLIQENALAVADQILHDAHKHDAENERDVKKPSYIKQVLIWFHHVKSLKKRKCILEWSRELNVGGYLKSGFPGILIIEGEKSSVDMYVKQVQSLHWQAMSVRGVEEEEVQGTSDIDSLRLLPIELKEVEEERGGMSELGQYCKEANLEHLFLSAMKISR